MEEKDHKISLLEACNVVQTKECVHSSKKNLAFSDNEPQ